MHGGNVWAAARATGRPVTDWVDFSASINPLGSPPWVRAAIRAALRNITHYPDPACFDLVRAAAARYRLASGCILFGNGAAELIHLLVTALKPPQGLVLAPTFARYAAALQQAGIPVQELPAWPDPPDEQSLRAWLAAAPQGSILFLCNPNNPTGRLLPEPLLRAALDQERIWVVVDEAFLEFVPGGVSLLPLAGAHPRLVVLRSLTKLYAIPGLRLGWVCAPASLVHRLAQLQTPWSVNGPAIAAGTAALTGPDYLIATQVAVSKARSVLVRHLVPFRRWLEPLPSDCNYFLARLQGMTGAALQERLLPFGILVRPCQNFSGLGEQYIRLAVRPRRESERLAQALAEVRT